ncbi:MAG: N-acetylglucosamine-6-phosphate deacetylase [Bryocella sp.]
MPSTITARNLITDIGVVAFPVITLDDAGNIREIASDPNALSDSTDTLTAAFFDVHTHGGVGVDVMQASAADLSKLQRFYAQHGVSQYLPTTVTAPIDSTLRALEALADAIESTPREQEARPMGIHLEGPFLSHAKRGVHPPPDLQAPSIQLFDRFQTAARGHIQLITIAPEPNAALKPAADGTAIDLIRHAASQGVRVSLGHTNATAAETLPAIDAGATSATHTYNAMRALDHREPGVLGTVLDNPNLFAELICDGVHVAPPLIRLWLKAKTPQRALLVTDSMSAAGMSDGIYKLGNFDVTVKNGIAWLIEGERTSLAGSLLTLDRAVANLQAFTSAPLADATHMASHTPAAMLGRPEATRITLGAPANLNRFDAQNKLTATYIRGQRVPIS